MMGKKNIFSEEQIIQVKELFDKEIGSRVIAKKLGITRHAVQSIYKQLGIYNINRKTPKIINNRTEYKCKTCNEIKSINNFRKRINKKTKRISHEPYCLICEKESNSKRLKKRAKILRKTDVGFSLRCGISFSIWKALNKYGKLKNKQSCMKYLNYSIQGLKDHLEDHFELWMNWENHGKYNLKTWNDNDQSTWTWQLDHIIPQSDLPYSSMEDENFKRCWALVNLRPLSSKQNLLDGVNRTRHIK